MDFTENIKKAADRIERPDWSILAEIVADPKFDGLLNNQQRNVLRSVKENPNVLNSYSDYIPDILSKYYGWKIYRDSNLAELQKTVDRLTEQVRQSEAQLGAIKDTAKHIGSVTVLVEYSKAFKTTANSHFTKAQKEFKYFLSSLLALLIITWLIFFINLADIPFLEKAIADDIKNAPLNIGFFALKAILLVFAYQISQVFRKNYNAEKHLEEVYQHRSDVLQSLHAVYNSIDDMNEKNSILGAAALFVYERGETGYITTKEGAGSGDGLIEGILSRIVNK